MSVTEIFYAQPVTVATEAAKVTTVTQVEELIYVKSVRAFALCVIVTLHVAFPLIHLYNSISYSEWWMGNYFYIWGKIGSPLFTMVSGLLLLNPAKDQPLSLFFRKRFMKVLLPFAAWSVIYLIWRIYLRGESFTPWEMMVLFVQGPVYYHLWFIQMILGLYLATPILRIYIRHATRQNLTYFLIVWLVTVSILPIIKRFFDFEVGIDITVTTGYVGFFVLGYYLRDITLTRRQIMASLLVVVASLLFTQYVTYAMTVRNNGAFDNFFVLNDSFNLVILAVSLFLFFKTVDYNLLFQKLPVLQKITLWISSCSLGVYFVHVLIIEELASGRLGFTLSAASFHPLLSIPALSVLVMILSVLVTMMLKRIPLVNTIVP